MTYFLQYIYDIFSVVFGASLNNDEKYVMLWLLCINFLCSHWEKYNTGIMYLPWAYDASQVTIFIIYIVSGIYGTALWSVPVQAFGGANDAVFLIGSKLL